MSGLNKNTSQDPDYEGPTGHEKKFYKTHFHVLRTLKGKKPKHPKDDPNWEYIGPGRWRWKNDSRPKETGEQADRD